MNHYKDDQNNIYAHTVAEVEHGCVKSGLTPITEEEAKAIIESRKPTPEPPTLDQVYALRAAAYADPQNGSDRHFLEAARKTAEGDTVGADAATQAGLARVAEIKSEWPLP